MVYLRTLILFLGCILISLFSSCQSNEVYKSDQLQLTINYPINWEFGEESEGVITLRSFYKGDSAIRISALKTQSDTVNLDAIMTEQLELIAGTADPNKPIEFGEIKDREHQRYSIVTGYMAGYPRIKVEPIDFLVHTDVAIIQFQERTILVTAQSTDPQSSKNAIDEIIKGLEFQ